MLQQHTLLHALLYIFKMPNINGVQVKDLPDRVTNDLIAVGFDEYTIAKAINWLVELAANRYNFKLAAPQDRSVRVYSSQELHLLSAEDRQYLQVLERRGVLNSVSRELVLDRLVALEGSGIDRRVIKFVIMMVLGNLSEEAAAVAEMLALDDAPYLLQ